MTKYRSVDEAVRQIDYTTVFPGGNKTAIVRTAVRLERRPEIALAIQATDPGIEQVGFLSKSEIANIGLDMPGDELCVNAIRSAAAVQPGNPTNVNVEARPMGRVFLCTLHRTDTSQVGSSINIKVEWSGSYRVAPSIKIAHGFGIEREGRLVTFEGIAHLLVQCDGPLEDQELLSDFYRIKSEYGAFLGSQKATGVIFWHRIGAGYDIQPVVQVGRMKPVCESGCGTGSIALALAGPAGDSNIWIRQPSRDTYQLRVRANSPSQARVQLGGQVKILNQCAILMPASSMSSSECGTGLLGTEIDI